ncbi:S24 family peptidase [Pseudomonas sp. NPDC090202]|uniref:S24 family peptidase n=1 Tax=Pseudomonas sp. NPDC090202 TaxID=3364476 RepID=UPI003822C50A
MGIPQHQLTVDITDQLTLDASTCEHQPMVAKENIRREFSKRLHAACNEAGVRERGRAVDIQSFLKSKSMAATTTAIGKWLNAESIPEADKLRPIAAWLGVRAEWLEYGLGPMRSGEAEPEEAAAAKPPPPLDKRQLLETLGFITIPHLNIAGSMGHGKAPEHNVEVIREITVNLDWLRTQGLAFSSLDRLAIITGDGDSMEPTFRDGDSLLVDRGITDIRTDAIYAFTIDDELFIKRLQRMTKGALLMISDNPKYDPIRLEGADLEKVHIHARVLLVWNVKKL